MSPSGYKGTADVEAPLVLGGGEGMAIGVMIVGHDPTLGVEYEGW